MNLNTRLLRAFRLATFLAVGAGLAGGGWWAFAANKDAESQKSTITVRVDNTPLPRVEGSELSFAPVVKRVTPSVVKVMTFERAREVQGSTRSPIDSPLFDWFFSPNLPGRRNAPAFRLPPREGLGSGVIVSGDGYIVTNNHVVEGADRVTVTLSDGTEHTAEVIGTDPKTDIAVIKVDARNLPAITFADSQDVQVGDRVLAIGNPFGIGQTVTTGIVSGTGRSSRELGLEYQDFIQTDAAINPGNSGGALVDVQGRLIGVNTAIYSRSGGFQGIGFAIPSHLVRHVMNSLVQYGKVTRGYLGVMLQPLDASLAEQFGVKDAKGVAVTEVQENTPASEAGLQVGDVIVRFGDQAVEDIGRFRLLVASTAPGTRVDLRVVREGKERTIGLTVGEFPEDEQVAANRRGGGDEEGVLKGVGVTDLTAQLRSEFDIPARIRGAIVTEVAPDSAAARVGLAPGDVILEINGQQVTSAGDVVRLTQSAERRKTMLRIWSRGYTQFMVVDETGE